MRVIEHQRNNAGTQRVSGKRAGLQEPVLVTASAPDEDLISTIPQHRLFTAVLPTVRAAACHRERSGRAIAGTIARIPPVC